jgi:hypothetical protein
MARHNMSGFKTILPKDNPSDEVLAQIKNTEGGVTDSANVIALIFDADEWGKVPMGLVEDTTHPAVSIEEYDDKAVSFLLTSETGSRTLLTADYVRRISEFTGLDLWQNPEVVLMNDSDTFPVVVHDPRSDGYLILAPRVAPDGGL